MFKIDPKVLGPKSRLGGWAHYCHLRNLKSLLTSPWWSQEQRSWMATRRSLQQIYHHNTDDSNDGERASSKPSQTNEKETLPLQHVSDNVPPRKTKTPPFEDEIPIQREIFQCHVTINLIQLVSMYRIFQMFWANTTFLPHDKHPI